MLHAVLRKQNIQFGGWRLLSVSQGYNKLKNRKHVLIISITTAFFAKITNSETENVMRNGIHRMLLTLFSLNFEAAPSTPLWYSLNFVKITRQEICSPSVFAETFICIGSTFFSSKTNTYKNETYFRINIMFIDRVSFGTPL